MIEDFKIKVFDLKKEFYIPLEHLTSQTVTEENLFTIVKNKNLVMENRNKTTPEIFETFLAENQSFIPLPNLGLSNYIDLSSTTSIAFGPTITSYAKILTDLAQHAAPGEDEDLYYTRDMGPYSWQKEGEAKIWNHISSMLGFSGSQVDPVKGLQSWDSFRR